MTELDTSWFSSGQFLPHGHCYMWSPGVLWVNVVADILIAMAYFTIPFALLYIARRRRDLRFDWLVVCFGVFIVACGLTHVMNVWNVWHAHYWVEGIVKLIAAAASVPTAILLWRFPCCRASASSATRTNRWRAPIASSKRSRLPSRMICARR
jgi:hypothetical protein